MQKLTITILIALCVFNDSIYAAPRKIWPAGQALYILKDTLPGETTNTFLDNSQTSFVARAKYSNKQVVWYEYKYWLDGTLLSDKKNADKFNDILFKKVNGRYYKAQVDGPFNVKDWGLRDDFEGRQDNSPLFQAMIDYFPEEYTASIYIPTGSYFFKKAIIVYRRPLHIFGDNGTIYSKYSSKLIFENGSGGFNIDRNNTSIQEGIFERLCLITGNGGVAADGFNILARTTVRDCSIKGFSRNNIVVWANMAEGHDASLSRFENLNLVEAGEDNMLLWGTDANAISVIGCDMRDAGKYNIEDRSFLGNHFVNCMLHNGKLGHVKVTDWTNTKSSFVNVYCEEGSPVSSLGTYSVVVGGRWGSGYTLGANKTVFH